MTERDALISAIIDFLDGQDLLTLDAVRAALGREIDEAGSGALVCLKQRLTDADTDWDYHPKDPLARRIHHVLADTLLHQDSELGGIDHGAAIAGKPVVIFANHLSYADANLLEILLQRSGLVALADRLTAMAGPKVFSNRQRRFSSLCFGTIRTPQNAARSTDEAVMSTRDVARAARRSIECAHARLAAGDALLVFGEGTRSRSHGMQELLAGVARYVDCPGTWVLPVGIAGTENLFPIGEDALHPSRILITIGRPIKSEWLREHTDGNRRLMMDVVGIAIAALLPPQYRGAYGENVASLDEARRAASDLTNDGR